MSFTETELTCSTAADSKSVPIRKQLDFLIVTSAAKSPPSQRAFDISAAYTAAVGRTPVMPSWGSLYWHCKNRYSNQTQLLTAARYLHKHVPAKVGVLVIDWFHWKIIGGEQCLSPVFPLFFFASFNRALHSGRTFKLS